MGDLQGFCPWWKQPEIAGFSLIPYLMALETVATMAHCQRGTGPTKGENEQNYSTNLQ
jgi:hypothetical protein